jgi:hypothetical protein
VKKSEEKYVVSIHNDDDKVQFLQMKKRSTKKRGVCVREDEEELKIAKK